MILTHLFNIELGDDKEVVILGEEVKESASIYSLKRVKGAISINDNELEDILINTVILSEKEEGFEKREINGEEMLISYELNCKV